MHNNSENHKILIYTSFVFVFLLLSIFDLMNFFGEPDYDGLWFFNIFLSAAFVTSLIILAVSLKNKANLLFSIFLTIFTFFPAIASFKYEKPESAIPDCKTSENMYIKNMSEDKSEFIATMVMKRINLAANFYYNIYGGYPIDPDSIINEANWNELMDSGLPYTFEVSSNSDSLKIIAHPSSLEYDTLIMKNGQMIVINDTLEIDTSLNR